MTLPAAFFGWLLATVMGLVYHLVRGGSLGRLLLYLLTAWVTFFLGHFVSQWTGWHAGRVGPLNLAPALAAAIIGLISADFLAGPPPSDRRGRRPAPPLDEL